MIQLLAAAVIIGEAARWLIHKSTRKPIQRHSTIEVKHERPRATIVLTFTPETKPEQAIELLDRALEHAGEWPQPKRPNLEPSLN